CAEGLMDAGCLPVLKHAPGHGRATIDSHKSLPRIDVPLAELDQTDFSTFMALADLPMVMTAHIVLPEIDPEVPVTLSAQGSGYLRDRIGIDLWQHDMSGHHHRQIRQRPERREIGQLQF
ncbi:MAG: hypothetical protein HKM96_09440, partial [Boseongicola sp.]|nr:hypothetical protein [Boseongicola sp.]